MIHRIVAAGLQDVIKPNEIGFYINIRMVDRIPHARLGSEVYDHIKVVFCKPFINKRLIRNRPLHKNMFHRGVFCSFMNLLQTPLLEADFVIIVHIIKADDCAGCKLF